MTPMDVIHVRGDGGGVDVRRLSAEEVLALRDRLAAVRRASLWMGVGAGHSEQWTRAAVADAYTDNTDAVALRRVFVDTTMQAVASLGVVVERRSRRRRCWPPHEEHDLVTAAQQIHRALLNDHQCDSSSSS
jgi:hypothetical protein